MSYVPLRLRSNYSLLRGASTIEAIVARAAKFGLTSLALTDENNLYGAVEFCRTARKHGIKPILGAIVSTSSEEAVLLVQNSTGYANLCELISRCNLDEDFSLADALPSLQDGLAILTEDTGLARRLSVNLDEGRLCLELVRPGRSREHERRIMDTARALNVKVAASSDIHFAVPEDFKAHEALLAMGKTDLLDNVREEAKSHRCSYLRSQREMKETFSDCSELLVNTLHTAESVEFDLLGRKPVFPKVPDMHGKPAPRQLREKTCRRARNRYKAITPVVRNRIEYELNLICRLGFASYFLIVSDIVDHARALGTPTAGRGSGASSIVSYCLGITNVDPLKYDISFERFLHEGRIDFPDLDIDFCWRLRDDVIDYVYKKYGDDHVAMVATYATLQPRLAFRETAKIFGLSDPVITKIRKRLSRGLKKDDWRFLPVEPEILERILLLAARIEGFPHHLSVHCGGVVITPEPVCQHAPLQRAEKGVVITQYDKNGVEAVGLVKLDLLGNRSLSTIREAVDLVYEVSGRRINPENITDGDEKTVEMLQAGNTLGCNQLESPAMRNLLQMLRTSDISGVMKALAVVRPGAASLGMKESFVRRERSLEKQSHSDPRLARILGETHGIMVYEDDVLLVAKYIAGLPTGEADRFRRAVTKCRSDSERLRLSKDFLSYCRQAGTNGELAKDLWIQMAKFNHQSFCRGHAASYALLAYVLTYLKAHYAAQFWVAALNNNAGMYPKRVYIEAAKRGGIKVLLPCVNRSEAEFTLEDGGIRVGLGRVTGLSQKSIESIIRSRSYSSLSDFRTKTGVGQKETESLIKCGALDFTGASRPLLLWQLYTQQPSSGGGFAFDMPPAVTAGMPELEDYDEEKKFRDEWEFLGLSTRKHPLIYSKRGLPGNGLIGSSQIGGNVGKVVTLAGILAAARTTNTSKGGVMSFLTLEDEEGLFEVTVFPDVYRRFRRRMDGLGPYVVTGRVESQYDSKTLTAYQIDLTVKST